MMWLVTVAGHSILVVAYIWIALIIGRGQTREKQWRSNPLASATFAIFLTCAIGHGVHVEHALLLNVGIESESGVAARTAMSDWLLIAWTPVTAFAAIYYLSKRHRLRILQGGAPLVEDLVKRQNEARILHEGVIMHVQDAHAALERGDEDAARRAIEAGMDGSQKIIAALLGKGSSVHHLRPGDLRRGKAT